MRSDLILALCVAATACGGGGDHAAPVDANMPDTEWDPPSPVCDVILQSGCAVGEKCTWIRVVATSTSQLGQLGCVPAGSKQLDEACTWGPYGAATGWDDCAAGLVCDSAPDVDRATGSCAALCNPSANPGAEGTCATGFACDVRPSYFRNPGDTWATGGLCDHTCDPLTNMRDDGVADCGGTIENGVSTMGCYGLPSQDAWPSAFTCTRVLDPAKTSDAPAYDAAHGVAVDSCAPGYVPLLYTDSVAAASFDQTKIICTAMCQPAPTSADTPANAGGAAPYTCAAAGAVGTHECRYWSWFEMDVTPIGKWSNAVGFCIDYTKYTYDGTYLHPPRSATAPYPSCTTLSSTAMTYDAPSKGGTQAVPDNVFWGCGPKPATLR